MHQKHPAAKVARMYFPTFAEVGFLIARGRGAGRDVEPLAVIPEGVRRCSGVEADLLRTHPTVQVAVRAITNSILGIDFKVYLLDRSW